MKNKKMMIAAFCLMAIGGHAEAQRKVTYEKIPDALMETLYASKEDTRWFTEAKFGVFVHWGPYVLKRVPASWGRWGNRPGAGKKATDGVPADVYDALYKDFNPVKFDADKWIKMVKDAGANYFIFTTKHHDGFCMFDARNTDYKITNTPFGRDVCKEIADACHKYGIRLFWYYSQPDWHHPDCLTENNENYREYMYEHLRQLLTDYGKVSGLFFDGLGTKYSDWDTPNMVKMIRELQPGIVINRRWGGNLPGGLVNGDYDNPEQEFGMFERERPWEMCSTISNAWSWTGENSSKTFLPISTYSSIRSVPVAILPLMRGLCLRERYSKARGRYMKRWAIGSASTGSRSMARWLGLTNRGCGAYRHAKATKYICMSHPSSWRTRRPRWNCRRSMRK